MLQQRQHKGLVAGHARLIPDVPRLVAGGLGIYDDKVFPVGDIVPAALLRAVQRHAADAVKIKHQRRFFFAAAQTGRYIFVPGMGKAFVHAEARVVDVCHKAAGRKIRALLICPIGVVGPAPRFAEQHVPCTDRFLRAERQLGHDVPHIWVYGAGVKHRVLQRPGVRSRHSVHLSKIICGAGGSAAEISHLRRVHAVLRDAVIRRELREQHAHHIQGPSRAHRKQQCAG